MNPTSVVHKTTLRVEHIRSGRGYRISGEIDLRTYDILTSALARLDGPGEILLDLHALEFCDTAGLGAMVELAERVWPAGTVVLDGASRQLIKMLAVLRWDLRPNLEVRARPAPPGGTRGQPARTSDGHDRVTECGKFSIIAGRTAAALPS